MVRIGIMGLGFMGRMHIAAYEKIGDCKIVAVADRNPVRAAGDLSGGWGNIPGAAEKLDMTHIRGYTDYQQLLDDPNIDAVDICLPTFVHEEWAIKALAAGKHVMCEKPLALDSASAQRIADAAAKAKGIFMPAMCIRFWPEWAWLKRAVAERRYGRVLDAQFHRVGAIPQGWFREGDKSGGAVLDLHVHDTDFVYHLFGMPHAVFSRGYNGPSGRIDAVMTHYLYNDDDGPPAVFAEGNWAVDQKFPFNMRYRVNFERATVEYNVANTPPLILAHDGQCEPVTLEGDGYFHELSYFVGCCQRGEQPRIVTVADAVNSIRIVEAEAKSVQTGQIVSL